MTRHKNHISTEIVEVSNGKNKIIVKHIVRHTVRVAASAGLWYAGSAYVHDSPMVIMVMIIGIIIQSIVEEIFKE